MRDQGDLGASTRANVDPCERLLRRYAVWVMDFGSTAEWKRYRDLDTNASILESVKHRLLAVRGGPRPPDILFSGSDSQKVIVFGVDATTPTNLAAVVRPIQACVRRGLSVAAVTHADLRRWLPDSSPVNPVGPREPSSPQVVLDGLQVTAVVGVGDFLPMGEMVHRWAVARGIPSFVVQHGLVAPMSPPAPDNSILLTWSEDDLEFWARGRSDLVGTSIGSQLLWEAAHLPHTPHNSQEACLFLGQLHGGYVPRNMVVRAVDKLRSERIVTYRPHPAEVDRLSRRQHREWQRAGLVISADGALRQLPGPVVSVFSAGVLEAAAAGLDAFVIGDEPQPWLRELWRRYHMALWGTERPTQVKLPAREPADSIVDAILGWR